MLTRLTFRYAALGTTDQEAKSSPGYVTYLHAYNPNTAAAYVHLYDALAADVTPGTTPPKQSFGIAANSGLTLEFPSPLEFLKAITVSASTAVDGSGAPTTGLLVVLGMD